MAPRRECIYNLGRIYERSGDLKSAAAHYRRFLETNPPEAQQKAAENRLRDILPRLPGQLWIESDVFHADVLVDGTAVGTTPLDPVEVSPGAHEVVLRHPEYDEARETVTVPSEGSAKVTLSPRRATGVVVVQANVPRAVIRVDSELRPESDLPARIEVPTGVHRVRVENAAGLGDEGDVVVWKGEETAIALVVPADPREGPAGLPGVTERAGPARPRWPWILVAAGIAAGGGGAALTVLAERDRDKVRSPAEDLSMLEAKSLERSANRKANGATALYAIGGAAIVSGVALLLFLQGEPAVETDDSPAASSLVPVGGRGFIGLAGSF